MKPEHQQPLPATAALRPYRSHEALPVATLATQLADLDVRTGEAELTRAGTDYHWYSPVLAAKLHGRRPDLVIRPKDVGEVIRVAAACAQHRVPLTPRGGGTGNYGQCVPLYGGVSLDLTGLNRVLRLEAGWARVEAGILIHELNRVAREGRYPGDSQAGQQLRMWPSTERLATLGGFIAGGHSGIGSMRHGILSDPGNVRRLRIVTLETTPRIIDLVGADIQKAHHAYGSNGIIVEVDVALTPWVEWRHTMALFESYEQVLHCGLAVGAAAMAWPREMDVFQLTAVERRITPYYEGLRQHLKDADVLFAQVAPASLSAFEAVVRNHGGRLVVQATEHELLARGLPSVTECAYNHTTLEALKTDRGVTYLQVAYPAPLDPALVARQMQRMGDEVFMHHEFSQAGGQLVAFALPLVQYFDPAQLRSLINSFEADGCWVFDPHTWVLEDGGMKQVDQQQLDFKKLADPMGLMNPGKVRAWDEQVLGIPGGQL